MREFSRLLLRHWQVSALFFVIAVAYVLETLLVPAAKSTLTHYHIGTSELHMLQLAVIIPYIIIWVAALMGYMRLQDYTTSLGDSKDGMAFSYITRGVLWFSLWLPISALISSTCNAVYQAHPAETADVVRLQNYANLILLVPAFIFTLQGSERLLKLVRGRVSGLSQPLMLTFIGFSAFYTFVVLEDTARRVAIDMATPASYYMPDWLIVLTIVVPRLILWFIGLQAIRNIVLYRRKVVGVIYKRALRRLASGLGVVVVMIIMLRVLQSLANLLNKQSLGIVLIIVYILLIGLGVGYVLVAKGARQLQQIEEA